MIIVIIIVSILVINFVYQYGIMIGRKRLADSIKPDLEEAKSILGDMKKNQS